MWRHIFWIVAVIVVIVAIVFAVRQITSSTKLESLSSLFKINFQAPSQYNNGKGGVSVNQTGQPSGAKSTSTSGVTTVIQNQGSVTPPAGFTLADLSPFYGQVKIGYVSVSSVNYSVNHISLSSYSLKSPVDITGWSIQSNKGAMTIPQAINDFVPPGFGDSEDILLPNSGRVDIYGSYSPISANLRMNECAGYLNNTYRFIPTLQCSSVSLYKRSDIATFPGDCQSFILSLGSCRIPTSQQLASFTYEYECRAFLDRFNYAGCYNLERSSPNFLMNQWLIWSPGAWPFDPNHDRALLLDKKGLLVDEYIY